MYDLNQCFCRLFVAGFLMATPVIGADGDHDATSSRGNQKPSQDLDKHAENKKAADFWKAFYESLGQKSQFNKDDYGKYDRFFSRDNASKKDLYELRRDLRGQLEIMKGREPKNLSGEAKKAREKAIKDTNDALEKVDGLFRSYNAYIKKNPDAGEQLARKRLLEIGRRMSENKSAFAKWAQTNRGRGFDALNPPPVSSVSADDAQYLIQMAAYASGKKKLKPEDKLALIGAPTSDNQKTRSELVKGLIAKEARLKKEQDDHPGPSIGPDRRTDWQKLQDTLAAAARNAIERTAKGNFLKLDEDEKRRKVNELLEEFEPLLELSHEHRFAEDLAGISERVNEAAMSRLMRDAEIEANRDAE